VAIICFNRPQEVQSAVESCLGLGFAEIIVLDNGSSLPLPSISGARVIRSAENLGVCGGRNLLLSTANTEFVLFLDDDAVLERKSNMDVVIESYRADQSLAIIAGLISRQDGTIKPHEFPFRTVSQITKQRRCGYFVGACFIARRRALLEIDGFDPSFFYGHEETDLSLRLAAKSMNILYTPDLRATHAPSQLGRGPSIQSTCRQLTNRLTLAARSLPPLPRVLHQTIWTLYYLVWTLRHDRTNLAKVLAVASKFVTSTQNRTKQSGLDLRASIKLHRLGYRVFW